MVLFAQEVHIALERHVEQSINRTVDAVANIKNVQANVAPSNDDDGVDEDIRQQVRADVRAGVHFVRQRRPRPHGHTTLHTHAPTPLAPSS